MAASLPVAVASDNYVLSVSPFKTIAGTPTIGTTAYDANDCVGGKGTLTSAIRSSGGGAIWQSLHIIDKENQKAALVIQVYNADPTSATLDNGSAIVHSTDIDKVIRTVLVASTDYSTVGGEAFADVNVAQAVVSAGTNLYYSAMALGTPTYTSTADLIFRFDFIQG